MEEVKPEIPKEPALPKDVAAMPPSEAPKDTEGSKLPESIVPGNEKKEKEKKEKPVPPDGPVEVLYKDSTVKQMTYHLKGGKMHGEYCSYDEKGVLIQKANYFEGEITGEVTQYTPEGKLSSKFTMLKGKLDGVLYAYTDGILTAEMTYKNGVLNGPFVSYHQVGGKSLEALYIMGKLEGPFVTYAITGKKVREMSYKEGKPAGECIDYYDDGTTVRAKYFYLEGQIEGLYTEYHKNGVISKKQGYKGGKPIGDPINYNESGKERPKEEPKVQSAILKLVGKK